MTHDASPTERALDVVLEPLREEDVDAAARIGAVSFPSGTGTSATAARGTDPDLVEAEAGRLREEIARPWAKVIVARSTSSAIVGFAVTWLVADEVHVLNVATDPAFRRRGVARRLMHHVIDVARERQARHILLEVRRSNGAAIGLYRGLGFYAMGVRREYYSDGEDAVEMVLVFDGATGAVVRRPDEVRLEGVEG